jgi:phosphoglycerate dehydrogenase-like enzyme
MPSRSAQPHPAVLILSREADAYARLLSRQHELGIPFTACRQASEAVAIYRGEPVVLGEPGLVASVIDQLAGVQWIQSTWAGVKPLLDLGRRPWSLTAVKGVFGPQMAEYVCGYLLAHELRLTQRAERQRQRQWYEADSGSLRGKRAGIMGTGSIGRDIAGALKSFGARVLGLSRSGKAKDPFDRVYPHDQLMAFLSGLDYLVAALPETASTTNLLDAKALAQLPPHAVLVNVGRGNVVDEQALVRALESGVIGAAVLDVFKTEPLPPESPLWSTPNTTITGHVAARSRPEEIVPLFLRNYRRFTGGKELHFLVDWQRGY